MKINSIKEDIKNFGKNYGSPIIIFDVNEKQGTDIDIQKIISTLNKFSYKNQEILFTGNPFFYIDELSQIINKLLFRVEIVCNGSVSLKKLMHLTNSNFCVILDGDEIDETISEYTYLSSFNRSYFLFEITDEKEIEKIKIIEKKYKLSPIFLTCQNNFKNLELIKKATIKNNWNLTPRF